MRDEGIMNIEAGEMERVVVEMLEGRPIRIWVRVKKGMESKSNSVEDGTYLGSRTDTEERVVGVSVPYNGPNEPDKIEEKAKELLSMLHRVLDKEGGE
jgi:hypothetical protein